MSEYVAERIQKPEFFKLDRLKSGSTQRVPYSIGFDSEAEKGKPFLYQFAHPDGTVDLIDVPARGRYKSLMLFVDYLFEHCKRKDVEYIVWMFNMQYEYTQLFRELRDDVKLAPDFTLGTPQEPCTSTKCAFIMRAFNNKRYALTIEFGGTKRRVKVLDAMAFFPMSLNAAAEVLGLGQKLKKPKSFSRRSRHTAEFEAYAKQDAILTQGLGEYIVGLHRRFDVPLTMTSPQFASRVFRHSYLSGEIALPHPNLEQFGLDSYHGGKNGFYLNKPELIHEAYHIDIKSAYPEAMRQLPDPEQSRWTYSNKYIPGVHAIWEIDGVYTRCKYRCLMGNSGWLPNGRISARVTGYELDTAIKHGEIELVSCKGYIMRGPTNTGGLVRYVDDFYAMKRDGTNSAEIAAAKLFLNSLYGKFFQKVPVGIVGTYSMESNRFIITDPTQDYDYIAGGLYHPPIASLITGFVRAKIHGMEHTYDSVMTSTDGIFALRPPDPAEVGIELGQLSTKRGELRIWRERTYVFTYVKDGEKKYLAALHGWQGTLKQLLRVPLTPGIYHYYAMTMVTLKMSLHDIGKKRYPPGMFVKRKMTLDLSQSAEGP